MMIPRSFGTHDGTFHADEVSACALLLVFNLIDPDKIFRTRDPQKLAQCEYVCDVGGVYDPKKKRFDHHQLEYGGELSSAGMIWLYLHDQKLVDQPLYDFVNHSIILGIDAHDIGKVMQKEGVCTFSHVIAGYVPIAYGSDEAQQNKAFFEALHFVVGHFERLFRRYQYILSCRDKVAAAMAPRNEALIFDEAMPWLENFFELGGENHPALFVIMPSQDHWKLRGIPPNPHEKMDVRLPLPEKWAGLRDEALQKASGIKGAIFCHKGRFISVWETKEDALKALSFIVGEKG
ncbi:MAG: MYG1 family protein [Verrucomicrobia bacterium]|nr:MYG1 family protein [Verrucomicrobiota bacterium]